MRIAIKSIRKQSSTNSGPPNWNPNMRPQSDDCARPENSFRAAQVPQCADQRRKSGTAHRTRRPANDRPHRQRKAAATASFCALSCTETRKRRGNFRRDSTEQLDSRVPRARTFSLPLATAPPVATPYGRQKSTEPRSTRRTRTFRLRGMHLF